ncbi:major capsid protein [Kiloniella sp. b19]|uniref:major capsid protein n=1 Tax=Kiloniella sp. GXU_MW_B19 TaxID=3141326 RepID=UPI0031CF8188
MPTLGNTYVDLIDLHSASPEGAVIELLKQENPILQDATAMECNKGAEHLHTIRTGLPEVVWGTLYKGIPQSKSTTQQVKDTTGFLEGLSSIDERLLNNYAGEPEKAKLMRMNEAMGFIEAMNQKMASAIFYESTDSNALGFKGLSHRFKVIGGGGSGRQVVDGGGTGNDNTSIWFVTWGDRFTHMLYPKGTRAGLQRDDMGRQRVLDDNGHPYYVLEEKFTWFGGIACKDYRYNVRVANIDVSQMKAGNVDLYALLRQGYYRLQNRKVNRGNAMEGRVAIYCNRNVLEALDALAHNAGADDSFVRLTPKEIEGQEVLTYRGIPIRETDALLNTEERVLSA